MEAYAENYGKKRRPTPWLRRKIVKDRDLDRLEELIDLTKVSMEEEPRFEISNCECKGACQSSCNDSCRGGCRGGCVAFCMDGCVAGCEGSCMRGCASGCRAYGKRG